MGFSGTQISQWPQLWAKTSRDWTNQSRACCRYHPLPHHTLDVAAAVFSGDML
jgi:hypothetical protein